MSEGENLMRVSDARGRPLVMLRRTPKGEFLTVLMRYRDMTGEDKAVVRAAFRNATKGAAVGGDSDGTIGDVERFIAFEEDRPCG